MNLKKISNLQFSSYRNKFFFGFSLYTFKSSLKQNKIRMEKKNNASRLEKKTYQQNQLKIKILLKFTELFYNYYQKYMAEDNIS